LFCLDCQFIENKLNNSNVNVNQKMKCSNYWLQVTDCEFQVDIGKQTVYWIFIFISQKSHENS